MQYHTYRGNELVESG